MIFIISLSILGGAFFIFLCGVLHLASYIGIENAFMVGLIPFILSESLKILLAISLTFILIHK